MSELLPCPFCSGRAEQRNPEQPHGGMVHCVSCGAEAFGPKWNTRATTPTASELVEALLSSMALIDRLMHVHVAPDECTSYVEQSRQWFYDNGGTLAALADQQAANRAALSNIGEA